MRKFALLAAVVLTATLAFAGPASADEVDIAVDITGEWKVTGTNPGATNEYQGTLTITKAGEIYQLVWTVGSEYEGTGILRDGVLAAVFVGGSGGGVVLYKILDEGRKMEGVWVGHKTGQLLGTETLTK